MLLKLSFVAGPAKAGNVFTGTATWVSCQNRADHPVKITITGVAKTNFFGPRLLVRGKVAADFVDDDTVVRTLSLVTVISLMNALSVP
jgi:hypothetical protein